VISSRVSSKHPKVVWDYSKSLVVVVVGILPDCQLDLTGQTYQ